MAKDVESQNSHIFNESTLTSRRTFLATSAASGSFFLTINIPFGCASTGNRETAPSQTVKTLYLEVTADNQFKLTFDKVEMGQGVITGQATLFGEEADIEPSMFEMLPAPADTRYGTMGGAQITGGSTSTVQRYDVLREAGAKYRMAVLSAASKKLGLPKESLKTNDGHIIVKATRNKYPYAEFNDLITQNMLDQKVTLKTSSEFQYIGKYNKSIDAKEKSTGKAPYGIDFDIENKLVAIVIRPPVYGGTLKSFNQEKIKAIPHVVDCFAISGGVAIVCQKYHQTLKVRQAISDEMFTWEIKDEQKIDSDKLFARYKENLDANPLKAGEGKKLVQGLYELPFLSHAPLEPQNCTAYYNGSSLKIWAPSQMPTLPKNIGAHICGLDRDQVTVHTSKYLGGGFGRNTGPSTVDAIEITYRLKRPVQVVWSREDDMKFSAMRPMAISQLDAVIEGKEVLDWNYQTVSQSILQNFIGDYFGRTMPEWLPSGLAEGLAGTLEGTMNLFGLLPLATEGAKQPYELPYSVSTKEVELDVPTFFWRAVGNSINGFVTESFVDEVALAMEEDPYVFRSRLLKKDTRALGVVEAVAKSSGFEGRKTSKTRGLGMSYHYSFNTHVAQVADVEVINDETIKVHKMWCAVDCGRVINPHIVEAQVKSGIVYGLSAAMRGEITFKDGIVQQENFDTYRPLYLNEAPDVEVMIIESQEKPTGIGEPGLPPAASAVANAVAAITGKRLRRLPFNLKQEKRTEAH